MANREAILNLRIFIQATQSTKTMRFGADMSVGEILKELSEREGIEGGKDHGLFSPPNKETGKKAFWLAKNRALRFYGIGSNALLEYKKKHRPLRIRLADDTQKTVIIDDSATVRQIADQIGEKIGLKSAEEFSLRKLTAPGMAKAPNWLNEVQTLHEQDVIEEEELEFAKRFFYSDDNIDKDDPFTLHLLYVEANKAIIDGRYPVTRTDAKDFAALQMQVVFGDHDVNKHKPGFFDLDTFLPPPYRKDKKIISDILRDHKKLIGMKEMNAKYRYVQLVRSLKTYGITFFDCKEKQRGKRKPTRVLIGITRDRIMKVDPETMKTIKEWSLEQMRRWSSAHNTFTLDFGDYEDDYFNVITDEGEAMSQLIAGYIDIILKTRVDTERVVADDDDDVAEEEMMTGQFGIANVGMTTSYSNPYGQGAGQGAMNDPGSQFAHQYPGPMNPGSAQLPPSQKVNVVDMGSAVKMTRLLGAELGAAKGKFGPAGRLTEDEWRKQFLNHKAKVQDGYNDLLAKAKMSPSSLNRNDLDKTAKELAMEMNNMATAARNLAALNDENAPLVDGTKAMSDSIADLLDLMLKAVDEPNPPGLLEALDAAAKQFIGAGILTNDPKLTNYADAGAELLMIECINDVNTSMDDLLNTANNAAQALPPNLQKQLKDEIEKVNNVKAFAIQSLRDLAPSVLNPEVAHQIHGANATLVGLTGDLVGKSTVLGVPQEFGPQLTDCQDRVKVALSNLLESAKTAEVRGIEGNLDIISPAQELLSTLAGIRAHIAEPGKVIEGVRASAASQNKIISVAKSLAEGADPDTKQRLMNASNNISKSVKDLMNEARILSKDPGDLSMQQKVVAVVGKLEGHCQELITDAGSLTALHNLRFTSKTATANIIRLMSSGNQVGAGVSDNSVRADLLGASKRVQQSLAGILSALQAAAADPQNFVSQSELLAAAREQIPYYSELVSNSKKAARFITDKNKQQDLNYAANETADNLKLLMKAITDVSDMTNQSDLENALAEFDAVKADLETAEFYAHQGLLTPIPGQSRENALALLQMATDTLNKATDDMVAASKSGAPLPDLVNQAASGMAQVASAARSMASTISDRNTQKKIVGSAKELADNTLNLISLARALGIDKANPQKQAGVEKSRQAFGVTLGNLLAAARGLESKDVNKAIEEIESAKGSLRKDAPVRMKYKDASEALQGSSKALSAAVSQLTSVAGSNPTLLGSAAKMTGQTTKQLLLMVSSAASASTDASTADAILAAGRALADAMGGLLNAAKIVSVKKNPQTMQGLAGSSEKATQAIDELINSLGNATSPEAEQAIARIMAMLSALDSGELQAVAGSREDILNEFLTGSKDMARVTGSLVTASRVSAAKIGLFSKEAASVLKNILTTAKAASLADGSSVSMSLDGSRIVKGAEFIVENPSDSKRVLGCAKKITQAGAKLIVNAKEFARAEQDKNKRAEVVRNAQAVVNTATQLAQAARDAAAKRTPESEQRLVQVADKLKEYTVALEGLMRPPESMGQQANEDNMIDPAVAHQLMSTSRTVALETANLIRASSAVGSNPENPATAEDLKRTTRQVTEAIQQLIKHTGALNPGVQECERAIQTIQTASAELEAASIAATVGNLSVPGAERAPFSTHQMNTSAVCKDLADDLKAVVSAAGGSSKELVAAARAIAKSVPQLVDNLKLTAGSSGERAVQTSVLHGGKDLSDAIVGTLKAVMNANPNDKLSMTELSQAANGASEALGSLLGHLQSGQQLHAELDRIARDIQQALATMAQPAPPSSKSYADCREDLSQSAKGAAGAVSSLLNVDKRQLGQVNLSASRLGEVMTSLIESSRGCIGTTREQSAKNELLANTKAIGAAVVQMIGHTKAITAGQNATPQLRQAFNNANASIANLLSAAKKGAVGEMMMDEAIEVIDGSVAKLNTASIFAQAGQLEVDKNAVDKSLQQLHQYLGGAASKIAASSTEVGKAIRETDEKLGGASIDLSKNIKLIADISAATASRISDSLAQQDVLSAAKSVAIASHQLILSAKDAQRLPNDNTAQQTLVASQTAIGESVNRLMTAVKNSGSEAARGEREIEEFKNAIMGLLQNVPGIRGASADDVVAAAREVLGATADLAFASDLEQSIAASKTAVDSIEKLLNASKGASATSNDPNVQKGVTQWAGNTARSVVELLDVGKLNRQDPQTQQKVEAASGKVSAAINGLITALRKLPNAEHVTIVDHGIDLDAKAEQELMKCAQIIEAAARTLLAAKPPPRQKKDPNIIDKMDISDAIFDAASAIARATGSLVSAAAVAQRERVENLRQPGQRYQNDPTWANGLISASQSVASAVQQLVQAAQACTEGEVEEEALVASARAVASATAHLVAAARAKSDPNSKSQQNLSGAAKAVASATSQLVAAAGKAAQFQEPEEEEEENIIMGGTLGKTKELEQQMRILRLEKELENERRRMAGIRKAKYAAAKKQ